MIILNYQNNLESFLLSKINGTKEDLEQHTVIPDYPCLSGKGLIHFSRTKILRYHKKHYSIINFEIMWIIPHVDEFIENIPLRNFTLYIPVIEDVNIDGCCTCDLQSCSHKVIHYLRNQT